MQTENVQYFLALSALYFTLTDKNIVSADCDDLLDFVDAINQCNPLYSPGKTLHKN